MSGSRYKLICPHCKHPMRGRNSVCMHPLMRNVYFECKTITCGAPFGGHMAITHSMSPPTQANPEINLPIADSAMRRAAMKEQDDKQLDIDDLLET